MYNPLKINKLALFLSVGVAILPLIAPPNCHADETKTPFNPGGNSSTAEAKAADDAMREYIAASVDLTGGRELPAEIWTSRRINAMSFERGPLGTLAAHSQAQLAMLDLIAVQNARVIDQNNQIIDLLKKIAAK